MTTATIRPHTPDSLDDDHPAHTMGRAAKLTGTTPDFPRSARARQPDYEYGYTA
ncbi:hypothetical protein [Kitasatospora sp. NPDC059327]|uniref:hypothetical protein n=1 Tax=Kitasatospora sp. NPDC059327 TaxID=3346803 RepID=UPI00368C91E4